MTHLFALGDLGYGGDPLLLKLVVLVGGFHSAGGLQRLTLVQLAAVHLLLRHTLLRKEHVRQVWHAGRVLCQSTALTCGSLSKHTLCHLYSTFEWQLETWIYYGTYKHILHFIPCEQWGKRASLCPFFIVSVLKHILAALIPWLRQSAVPTNSFFWNTSFSSNKRQHIIIHDSLHNCDSQKDK